MPSKPRFDKDSPFTILERETTQDSVLRRPLIKKLEKSFGGKIVCYFASFRASSSSINDSDAEMLEGILSVEHTVGNKLLLVINSPGGQGLAAERIVNTCRAYSHEKFEAIVPHMAKSAATMICFGASAIHMSQTAELGPVDPQVPYWPGVVGVSAEDEPMWISAEEYVRSYDKLIDSASGKAARIEPFIQQLNRYDSRYIEQLRSAQDLAKNISVRMLANGMMQGKTTEEIEKSIQAFLSQVKKSSHGRMITASEAEECGLKIKMIDLQSVVWHTLWELYVRSNWTVNHRCSKLLETSETAVSCP